MNLYNTYATIILGTASVASADVVMDQVGDMDGSGIADNIMACQDFEADFDVYDVVVADNFSGSGSTIAMIEMVLGGWNGFADPSSIHSYTANIYSSPENAGKTLTGDIATQFIDAADATVSPDWMGANFLVSMNTDLASSSGDQLFGLIPGNDYGTSGQTGCADSNLGDTTSAIQANPGGGFGFGPWQEAGAEAAYRLTDDGIFDPCTEPLPTICTTDVDGDMVVAVGDLLTIIGNWGVCGDGTYRPVGDVAPMPNGDCCVNVSDLLAVIATWGEDCTPNGACCSETGTCTDNVTQSDCLAMGGLYMSDGSQCSDNQCVAGACCLDPITCLEGQSMWYCDSLGGIFRGDGVVCADISCDASCEATGCQPPDQTGQGADGIVGATSDTNTGAGFVVADNFLPTTSGSISQVCWWGMYIDFSGPLDCGVDGPGTGDNFTVTYFLDDVDGTQPGTMIAGPFSVSTSAIPTGEVIPSGIGDIVQYQYSANHDAFEVQSGECYWVSISNQTTESCYWLWETAPPGDSRASQNNDGWSETDYDLSFCVNIDIDADACGVFTGPCCLSDGTCEIMTSLDCLVAEGEYEGNNLTCADVNDCVPLPGACCFSQDTCFEDTTDLDCDAFGGIFMGEASLCADISCGGDQIGGSDGGSLDGNTTASQIFEPDFATYDIATLDNFSFDSQATVVSIETVINGWNGYADINAITNYTISVYSSVEAAGADLVGDVYSVDIMTPTFPDWTGDGTLINLELNLALPAGDYFFAVIPWNNYGENGQTGISGSNLGDGVFYQANPAGGFGFGPWQESSGNAAYRLILE